LIEADCIVEHGALFCREQVRGESADVCKGVQAGRPIVFINAESGGAGVEYVVDHALRCRDLMLTPKMGYGCLSELTTTPTACTIVRATGKGRAPSGCRAVGDRQRVTTLRTAAMWTDVSKQAVMFQAGKRPAQSPSELPAAAGFHQALRAVA
jgi:hypothetical protein